MNNYKDKIDVFLEYYVELPFNLALPTGYYALNIPRQLRLHRDMYFLQKGNEIENVATLIRQIVPSERLFDDRGLVDTIFSEFNYIRKMKTVIFTHYKVQLKLTVKKEEFEDKFMNGRIKHNDLKIPSELTEAYYKRFRREINEYLSYYKSYFTINDKNHLLQHEINPLSSYEFSKCTTGILLVYNNQGIELHPIIEDYGNYYGIPEFTFPHQSNKKKFSEFEKLITQRKNIPLSPYQKMFDLAKEYYRTKKKDMISLVIINAITAFESMLNILELIDPIFKKLKIERENELYGKHKKKIQILNFYLNFYRRKKDKYRPNTIIRITRILLSKLIIKNHPLLDNLSQGFLILKYLNFTRLIRNQIIHEGDIDFEKEKNIIHFKSFNNKIEIDYDNLWNNILKSYNALNSYILSIKYPQIDWNIESNYLKTHIATSVAPSKKGMVLVIPNIDWREIYSYKSDIPEFTIPPEKFPVGLKTNDGKIINLNLDFERGKYEVVDQKITKNGEPEVPFRVFPVDITYDQFKEKHESKNLNVFISAKNMFFNFRNCPNCDFILAIHRHIEYKSKRCPKCKEEFNLNQFIKDYYLGQYEDAKEKAEYNKALKFLNIVIEKDQNDVNIWDNRSYILIKLGNYNLAIESCDKALELDSNFYNAYYNKSCAFSLKNNAVKAINYLQRAINGDIKYKEIARTDSDFENIRNMKEFKELLKN
ncbi:MAG: tetratricopeptide repeat protein [Promethearchaeota archaeon]|nr:MAG: tetratricopeptide repeat protein [Candidatus Lokiarchaeota archaeon]